MSVTSESSLSFSSIGLQFHWLSHGRLDGLVGLADEHAGCGIVMSRITLDVTGQVPARFSAAFADAERGRPGAGGEEGGRGEEQPGRWPMEVTADANNSGPPG